MAGALMKTGEAPHFSRNIYKALWWRIKLES
jgi:hypothetical protein